MRIFSRSRPSAAPAASRYEKRFTEARQLELPDWHLMESVEALLGPTVSAQGPFGAYDDDDPVTYGVRTVADLRAAVEQRGKRLWAIRVLAWIEDPKLADWLYVRMYLFRDYSQAHNGYCYVVVSAGADDELFVKDMIARLREVITQAADRFAVAHPPG